MPTPQIVVVIDWHKSTKKLLSYSFFVNLRAISFTPQIIF